MVEKIKIICKGTKVFYHVHGDMREYLDLENIELVHPEYSSYLHNNRLELKRKFLQTKELAGVSE